MNYLSITILLLAIKFTTCATKWPKKGSDGDEYLNSYQLIEKYTGSPQKHAVITEDGYVINLFRIPQNGPPVLLVHGIADSSDSWLVLGPEDSLAFILADYGYDVWLYNARGNKYSKGHMTDNISPNKYWNFSFEEMGTKDLTATIDYILHNTARQKLTYVGFSQGTTIFLVLGSMRPDYNDKIEKSILLAPVGWINNIKYPFIGVYARSLDILVKISQIMSVHELFPQNFLRNIYHAEACRQGLATKLLCDLEYLMNYGIRNSSSLSPERFPVIGSHIPAGTSANTFFHFLQLYRSNRFQRFDRGERENQRRYESPRPPEYNVSRITVPVTIIASEDDWFSDIDNVNRLRKLLPNVVKYLVLNKTVQFSHIEYVYGSRAKSIVNEEIMRTLLQDPHNNVS